MPLPDRLILMRHAQSEENYCFSALNSSTLPRDRRTTLFNERRTRYTDGYSCGLTQFGEEQARTIQPLAQRLLLPDGIVTGYVSPQPRAVATAKIVWPGVTFTHKCELRERKWGDKSQVLRVTQEELDEYKQFAHRMVTDHTYKPPGGESVVEKYTKLWGLLINEVFPAHQNPGEQVILVCHGETLQISELILQGLPADRWANARRHTPNCHISVYSRVDPVNQERVNGYRWRLTLNSESSPEDLANWEQLY